MQRYKHKNDMHAYHFKYRCCLALNLSLNVVPKFGANWPFISSVINGP